MTRHNPIEYLFSIPGDEPVFIVRAKDTLFSAVVRTWIREATAIGVNEEKIDGVKSFLVEGCEWQAENPDKCKDPD